MKYDACGQYQRSLCALDASDCYGLYDSKICFGLQGMICLTLSATVSSLRPPPCSPSSLGSCQPSHGIQIGVLYLGLFLFAVGNGGIKPNVSTLGADQFDEGDPNERKHMSHFFNWFYFIISIGSLLSVTLFVYIQVCCLGT